MDCLKSLIYPEHTSVQCPYTMSELAAAAQNAPDSSYPILNLENREIFKPLPENEWFERGTQYRVIDLIGNILALPEKILLWNSQYHSNYISQETEEILKQYMQDNKLQHVKVRLNQYDPFDEIKRYVMNARIGILAKILLSPIALTQAMIPNRVYGSDNYSLLTDTIHIVSNVPAIALHEAGHAKDFASHKYPVLYALFAIIPFVTLYQEGKASGDAIHYLKAKNFTKLVPDAYALLAPAYATYVANTVLQIVVLFLKLPFGFVGNLTPRIAGVIIWLVDPLVTITHPVLLKIAFVLEKFPPFLSRITVLTVGLGHLAGRVSGYCYSRNLPNSPPESMLFA